MKLRNIKTLKITRGEPYRYLGNFLCNIARATILMHNVLKSFQNEEHIVKEASRNYIIAMASCMETFYRDLYIFVLDNDNDAIRTILVDVREKTTLADIHQILSDGATFSDIATASLNFQNIEQIEASISKIFAPKGYVASLTEFELECLVPAKGIKTKVRLPENWRTKFAELFQMRHEYVHNSNFEFNQVITDMAELETLILLIAQLTAYNIAQRFGGKGAFVMAGQPVLFTVEDLLRDDWQPSSDRDAGISIIKEG